MASASTLNTCGRIMEKIQVDSVTSEDTGFPIEDAFDYNLDRPWKPTTIADQVITLDLNNDLQESIILLLDRDFNTAAGTNWTQGTMNSFSISLSTLLLSASASSQFSSLGPGGFGGFVAGRTYRITYDYTENVAGFSLQTGTANQAIGTMVAGTSQTVDFICNEDSTSLLIVSTSSSADGEFDNFSIQDVTYEDDFDVDGFAVFIRNYQTHFGTDAGLKLEYSVDSTIWVEFADKLIESEMNNVVGQPLRIYINSTSQARRYWRFTFHDMNEIVEVGQLFLLRQRSVSLGNAWPEKDRSRYQNRLTNRRGQSPFTVQGSRRSVRHIPRQWQFITQTQMDALDAALDDCFGSVRPFIFNEDTDYRVVLFLQNEIDPNESAYQVYSPRVVMQELPYIEDGQVY